MKPFVEIWSPSPNPRLNFFKNHVIFPRSRVCLLSVWVQVWWGRWTHTVYSAQSICSRELFKYMPVGGMNKGVTGSLGLVWRLDVGLPTTTHKYGECMLRCWGSEGVNPTDAVTSWSQRRALRSWTPSEDTCVPSGSGTVEGNEKLETMLS